MSDSLSAISNKMFDCDNQTTAQTEKSFKDESIEHKTTKLKNLNIPVNKPSTTVSFLDDTKRLVTCNLSQPKISNDKKESFMITNCFWCRHPFDSMPIGCPVRFVPAQAIKRYKSVIGKDSYTIKESVTTERIKTIHETNILKVQDKEVYETDGCFCSFNCCQAYINDNKHNRLYDDSTMLLKKMYCTIHEVKYANIIPAPHWRTLNVYGGHLNIVEYKESFNRIEYEQQGVYRAKIDFVPLAILFEERYRF